ncbi:unnamed protein product [Meloidogyne enterolobii]|uniref:Uncharacterized protein n=1 Tax=Meloidogyne enterolobii TaxID=390850 RepID=A0ACB1A7M4_MELEN
MDKLSLRVSNLREDTVDMRSMVEAHHIQISRLHQDIFVDREMIRNLQFRLEMVEYWAEQIGIGNFNIIFPAVDEELIHQYQQMEVDPPEEQQQVENPVNGEEMDETWSEEEEVAMDNQ